MRGHSFRALKQGYCGDRRRLSVYLFFLVSVILKFFQKVHAPTPGTFTEGLPYLEDVFIILRELL